MKLQALALLTVAVPLFAAPAAEPQQPVPISQIADGQVQAPAPCTTGCSSKPPPPPVTTPCTTSSVPPPPPPQPPPPPPPPPPSSTTPCTTSSSVPPPPPPPPPPTTTRCTTSSPPPPPPPPPMTTYKTKVTTVCQSSESGCKRPPPKTTAPPPPPETTVHTKTRTVCESTDTGCKPSPPQTKTCEKNCSQSSPAPTPSSTPAGKCPYYLAGKTYQIPHQISVNGGGQSFNGKCSATDTTTFSFDIPPEYAGKTCDLVFAIPAHGSMETSEFTMTGSGSLEFTASGGGMNSGSMVGAENSAATISSATCTPGQVTVTAKGTGSLSMAWFQDFNPCPIGLYVVAR